MGVQQIGDKIVATPRRKNPGVPRMQFQALEERVAALEARIKQLEGEDEGDGWTVRKLRARLGELKVIVPREVTSKEGLLALLPEGER